MTGQSVVDAVTGDHSTDSHLGLLLLVSRRLLQLHLQAEHRQRRAGACREGGKAKKSASELHGELHVDL